MATRPNPYVRVCVSVNPVPAPQTPRSFRPCKGRTFLKILRISGLISEGALRGRGGKWHQPQGQPWSIRCRRRVAPAPARPIFDRAPARLACDRSSRAPAAPVPPPAKRGKTVYVRRSPTIWTNRAGRHLPDPCGAQQRPSEWPCAGSRCAFAAASLLPGAWAQSGAGVRAAAPGDERVKTAAAPAPPDCCRSRHCHAERGERCV